MIAEMFKEYGITEENFDKLPKIKDGFVRE
jgi:hypothetical protein